MKYAFCTLLICCAFCLWSYGQEQIQEQEQEEEVIVEEQGEELSNLEAFYSNTGFSLFPKTEALSWRNVFSNRLYFDSNVFLAEGDDRDDDLVFATELASELRYTQENWQLGATGVLRYEDYFDENSLDELLPKAIVDFSYKGRFFYMSVKNDFSRNSVPNTVELNDRSPWVQNVAQIITGVRYKAITFEILSIHKYLNFTEIEGDYENYGQGYVLKYHLRENVAALVEYNWDYINYREALVIGVEEQEDTYGYRVLPGAEISFSERLVALVQVGFEHRSDEFVSLKAVLSWIPTPNLRFTVAGLRQTLPTFAGDFQLVTTGKVAMEYLFSERLATKTSVAILHSNPENGGTSYRYDNELFVTYRLIDGLELEVFSLLSVKDNSDADFTWWRAGGALNVVF